jgi:NACHT N-terminal Helical domain 1/NACHT domain
LVAGIEVAAISLGAAVVKGACKLWLGDRQYASDVTSDLADLLAGRVTSRFEQRKVGRFFDDCADIVARRLVALLDAEFRNVPGNEREAAVLAVRDTFAWGRLTDEALFNADLDARLVERQLRPAVDVVLPKALLGEGGEQVYSLILRESCSYLVEVVTTLPKFSSGALTELLRRQTAVLETLSRVLDRLPERRGVDDFAADYDRVVVNKLDRMELLGVTLADSNRRYPLSVAYIDLSVMRRQSRGGRLMTRTEPEPGDLLIGSGGLRAEGALGSDRRILIVGQAGSGKTTLLRWLAVRSARGDFGGSLTGWNDTVPFFIPLRRYVNRDLPAPQEFPLTVGQHLAHEMPEGWVHGLMRTGRALVLVDGVDETPEGERERVRAWLDELRGIFPAARYVVTSRPAAIEEGWLDGLGFATTELQPMSASDVAQFIHQWHEAVMVDIPDADERGDLAGYERSLIAAIDADRHLRALTVNPLLCALLCALNRERRTQLPNDRMEIYDAALEMLLERRDRERGVAVEEKPLTRTDKILLLQDIAFWLVRNGWSDAPADRVVAQVGRSLQQLRGVQSEPSAVFRSLLERSGVLREATVGRIDFVHRIFQEYLAGKAAVDDDEIGQLVANAHNDQWREVVVMAAGHAQPDQCAELLHGLLRRGRRRAYWSRLRPLAVACMQTARRLDPQLRMEIERVAEQLVPPATRDAAEALAEAGEMLVDLLRSKPPRTAEEAAASIRAAAKVGGGSALRLIADILERYAEPYDARVDREVMRAWRFFKPDQYVKEVLARSWPVERELQIPDYSFIDVLHTFPELSTVRCELRNLHTGAARLDLSPLTRNQKLRSVALTECGEGLDLTPLLHLPVLQYLELAYRHRQPKLAVLARIPRPWTLTLACRTCGDCLHDLAELQSLTWLHLRGFFDLTDLSALPSRPQSLETLSLYIFPELKSLAGIERWDGLKTIELFECPRLTDLGALAAITSLECLSLGLFRRSPEGLSPLTRLPHLRKLSLMGNSTFDITTLAGMPNLTVHVPAKAKIIGADKLGPMSRVTEFEYSGRSPRRQMYEP